MRSYLIRLALLLFVPVTVIVLAGVSCKKKSSEVNSNQSVVGDWVWVSSSGSGMTGVTPASTGIQKKLSFRDNGTVYITHNDSTADPDNLFVSTLSIFQVIKKTVTETAAYHTEDLAAACVNIKFPTLLVNGETGCYQYSVSSDTLQISSSTCLAPFLSIYVRGN